MKKILILFIPILLLMSCETWLDVNESPNTPQETDASNRLLAMIDNSIHNKCMDDWRTTYYVQYFANTTPYYLEKLQWSTTRGVDLWRNHYWQMGKNVNSAIEDAKSKNANDYVGAIKTLWAWSWIITTDRHGAMPLSEALTDEIAPKYDSQKEIYAHANQLLDEAIVSLDEGGSSAMPLSSGDLMYNGNVTKWKMFAYALKARIANHLSKKSDYDPTKVIEYCDNSFTSNADNPEPFFIGSGEGSNTDVFWSPARKNMDASRPTRFLISLLDGSVFGEEDPRLRLMFNESDDGTVKGITPSVGDENTPKAAKMYNKYWSLETSKERFISYWEVQFIKAEAALHKGDKSLALSAYKEGIRAHMDYAQVQSAVIESFLISDAVVQNSSNLSFKDIMCQKYVAMFPSATETWTDMRRFDYATEVYDGLEYPENFDPKETGNGHWPRRWMFRRYSEGDYNKPQLIRVGAMDSEYTILDSYAWKPLWWDRADDAPDWEYDNPQALPEL